MPNTCKWLDCPKNYTNDVYGLWIYKFGIEMIRTLFALLLNVLFAMLAVAETRPNILLMMADDMGYGDLSCYGSTQIQTPNIDALAAGGVKCTNAYVTSSVCAPSRAGLMTGRYPNRFGFEHNIVGASEYYNRETTGLPTDEITVADRLKKVGYQTACIGKWHLGVDLERFHPNSRGFDYYFGRYKGHGYFPKAEDKQIYRQRQPVTKIDVPYTTDWYTKEAIEFIDRVDDKKPWFIYLAHDTPHTPLQAKPEDVEKFKHIKNKKRRTVCAMQHCLDYNIGKLVSHLKSIGQFDNTLIVFLSDNGGITNGATHSINAPLNGQKSTFWDGGIRIPMIFSWPANLPKNVEYASPVISADFMPTFLAAAGHPLKLKQGKENKKTIDGVNLLPYLNREAEGKPHEELYWRISHRGAAIRSGNWKLVRVPHRRVMLYDLATDISEQNNLADQEPEITSELLHKLAVWEESFVDTPRWFSRNGWRAKNRKQYDQEYLLKQPQ